MRKFLSVLFTMVLLIPGLCWAGNGFVLLASTIGPIDSGIVGALEDGFEKETGIRVRHVGAGTGAALKIAEKGNVDIVMAHAKALEEKFIAAGYGTERIPLMYNDFVILGPANDPAGIKGMKTGAGALKAIAAKQALFITRGDKSGTHVAEMDIWAKAGIKPSGPWYVTYEKGSLGNVPTTKFSDEKGAYVFMDRATYLALKKNIKLVVLVENDEALLNYISLIPVNPKKFPRVNNADALTFAKWLTDPARGQKLIADFGKDKYGAPLFFPNSKEWQALNKK
ncbi:MAG: substrate-binding domain-containing protein [Syntrophaceae bacterium]